MEVRKMERKKTMAMNWDGLGDDDDEFFDPSDDTTSSSAPPPRNSDDDNEDFDDCHVSFASPSAPVSTELRVAAAAAATATPASPDYNIWMSSPGSIKARRKNLFQNIGLTSNKQLLTFKRVISKKPEPRIPHPIPEPKKPESHAPHASHASTTPATTDTKPEPQKTNEPSSKQGSPRSPVSFLLVRSRSEGEIESRSVEKQRKQDMLGTVSKQSLTRTCSLIATPQAKSYPCRGSHVKPNSSKASDSNNNNRSIIKQPSSPVTSKSGFEAFFLIKNLDTGKEFIVNEYDQDGMWNKLSDIQTGKKLTMEEFDKCVGYSPVVKELMRRANDNKSNSYVSKSLKMSMSKGAAMLKSIKGVANSMALRGEKERELVLAMEKNAAKNAADNQWVKVRQTGKSYKELSALHLCQEIQAHEGSIWTIKFNTDARFLASAGEDKVIHVWEVQECEVMSNSESVSTTPGSSPLHPSLAGSQDQEGDKKKGKGSGVKREQIPDYVHKPKVVFSLSDRPIYSFKGHSEDVLDLSWSKSQQLLSSSMDKTVRLWDLETNSCLKVFAHSDYVTCIHFNPADDDHFISGSLDAKVRIWNVSNRRVVEWTDLNEMVTAACYTPDGQGALIGSNNGNCRLFSTEECKLTQKEQINVQNKKTTAKKITGFQYCPTNPSQALVTSADSRIRILEGSDVIYKFSGFRNTSSQIAASFSPNGKYVLTASEDSQVFVWKFEEPKNTGTGKRTAVAARGFEQFTCKDVSVAISWPGTIKGQPPPVMSTQSKRNPKRAQPSELPINEDSTQPNKKGLPPLPKNNNNNKNNTEKTTTPTEEVAQTSPTDPGTSEPSSSIAESSSTSKDDSPSISSANDPDSSSSVKGGDTPSISSSGSNESGSASTAAPSIWSWFDVGGGATQQPTEATAWGLVIVTATLDGEIKIYQNFGLPRKIALI